MGATCVTSDAALYNECVKESVVAWRGLRPIIQLVDDGHLEVRAAIVTVRRIRATNAYITTEVVRAFVVEIRSAGKRAARRFRD
jgi:hypothetical protein